MQRNKGAAHDPVTTAGRRARHAGLCHHWATAKAVAPHISRRDLQGWFSPYLGTQGRLPSCPRRRLLWLVAIRAAFHAGHNPTAVLRVSAAIWREACRLRRGPTRCPLPAVVAPNQTADCKKIRTGFPKQASHSL